MIDGSIVKVHQDATRSDYSKSAEHIGYSVGGLSTKIHAKVDSFGQLLMVELTEGQVHESQVAEHLFAQQRCDYLLADKAYDIDQFRKNLRDHGVEAVIPSKRNRLFPTSHDKHIYMGGLPDDAQDLCNNLRYLRRKIKARSGLAPNT